MYCPWQHAGRQRTPLGGCYCLAQPAGWAAQLPLQGAQVVALGPPRLQSGMGGAQVAAQRLGRVAGALPVLAAGLGRLAVLVGQPVWRGKLRLLPAQPVVEQPAALRGLAAGEATLLAMGMVGAVVVALAGLAAPARGNSARDGNGGGCSSSTGGSNERD